ncbi:MAG: LysM peptidoglycan-binding domain-containing protein [Roseburia sp.]|nr:LysM peptidoglycan-binding domain-containing protein [Roseburia sp.]
MIEVKEQKEEKNRGIKLPKNIRQIGNPSDDWKIYMEDYVYTYLHPTLEKEKQTKKVCILLGKVEKDEKNYIFISGAIAVEPFKEVSALPQFTEEVWEYIYQQMKEYFGDLDIVGWSIETSFWPLHLVSEFENIHRRYFEGCEKVMLLNNDEEMEEKFYHLQNGNLVGWGGYYIYYEKNETMQNFMVQQYQKSPTEEEKPPASAGAISNYREIVKDKQNRIPRKSEHSVLCAAGVLTAMAVCVIGISTINNYEKMSNMQDAIQVLSHSVETETPEGMVGTGAVTVENIESDIEPLTKTEDSLDQNSQNVDAANLNQQQGTAQEVQEQSVPQEQLTPDVNNQQTTPVTGATTPVENQPVLTESETYLLQGYYIVQKGDSLALISQKIYQNVNKVPEICAKNGIADENTIYEGQKLLLP